jgi:hypothetical protein
MQALLTVSINEVVGNNDEDVEDRFYSNSSTPQTFPRHTELPFLRKLNFHLPISESNPANQQWTAVACSSSESYVPVALASTALTSLNVVLARMVSNVCESAMSYLEVSLV